MQSEINELQSRYDDLLMLSSARDLTADEATGLYAIEQRVREIWFPIPRQEDFNKQEWLDFWPGEEAARIAYDNSRFGSTP